MEKEIGHIKFTETEDGYRIDVTGKDLKGFYPCCCLPESGCCIKVEKCDDDSSKCCPDEKAGK